MRVLTAFYLSTIVKFLNINIILIGVLSVFLQGLISNN